MKPRNLFSRAFFIFIYPQNNYFVDQIISFVYSTLQKIVLCIAWYYIMTYLCVVKYFLSHL
jgi:hypothetical protein